MKANCGIWDCRKRQSRSTLAYANEHRPWQLYQTVFHQLLSRCQAVAKGKKKFRFKNKLMSLDATVIDLCAEVFDWAKFRQTKGAVKLHLLLDHDGYLPAFAVITEARRMRSEWRARCGSSRTRCWCSIVAIPIISGLRS